MKKLLVLGLVLIYWNVDAQSISSKELDAVINKTMQTFEVPGMAVAIIKEGKLVYAEGHGMRSLKTGEKTNSKTYFGIASNSKAFTAAGLGILVDEGKINWDDKVIDYIPEFRLYAPYVTEEFTIRDLLTHRSGLGLGAGDLMIFPDGSDFTIDELIHNMRYLKQESSFRSKFDYDNLLYIVAGEILKRVSGQTWAAFIEQRIMRPIGMKNSAALLSRLSETKNVANAHAPIEGKVNFVESYNLNLAGPAAGIYSNVEELSLWLQLLMNNGKLGDKQILSENVIHEMWSVQTPLPVYSKGSFNTHFSGYGLGFFLSDVNGYKKVSHTGGLLGMVTQVTMLPEMELGIIVLTNQQSGAAFSAVTNTILQAYTEGEKKDWVTLYKTHVDKGKAEAKEVTDKVWHEINLVLGAIHKKTDDTPYLGLYNDPWFGEVMVSKNGHKLWFSSKRSRKLNGELIYYKGNTFVVKWVDRSMDADAFVMFQVDEEGKAVGITMKAISPLTDFSYDFHDLDFKKTE